MKIRDNNKKIRVGINGFGRIGRAILRINDITDAFDIAVINDINPDIKNMAYLLQYDGTYGKFKKKVNHNEDSIYFEDFKVSIYHNENILDVPWDDYDVDVVIDSSGVKRNLQLIKQDNETNIKHYIITNASNDGVKTIIFGVNEKEFNPSQHKVLSSSICDTISLSPILKLIMDTHKINSGFLTTLHPWLSYQNLLDGPSILWS